MAVSSSSPLLIWLSPAFPIGSFAFSHGLEWAHDAGDVTDYESCHAWLQDLLSFGAGHQDAVLLAATWRAASARDIDALRAVIELAGAMHPSAERHLEAHMQGKAFMAMIHAAWSNETFAMFAQILPKDITYPVAVGLASAAHELALPVVLESFLLALLSSWVSASIRLGVIGQTDGQKVIAALLPRLRLVSEFAETCTLDDLGSCAFRSDLASLHHETQYTRLFRS